MTFRDAIASKWGARRWSHTVKAAADTLGVSESYIQKLVNLDRYPAIKLLELICSVLPGIDTDEWRKQVLAKRDPKS